jgi:hypothetical protein
MATSGSRREDGRRCFETVALKSKSLGDIGRSIQLTSLLFDCVKLPSHFISVWTTTGMGVTPVTGKFQLETAPIMVFAAQTSRVIRRHCDTMTVGVLCHMSCDFSGHIPQKNAVSVLGSSPYFGPALDNRIHSSTAGQLEKKKPRDVK